MSLAVTIKKQLGNFILDVSFETGDGIFALLGASGCGKSMTLKCIAGIETPDSGRIVLNDRVLFDSDQKINLSPQERKVGYLFQEYALFPNMTVEENILAGFDHGKALKKRSDKGTYGEKVIRYMEQFQLTGLKKHYPHQLSGGQKQRVAMARLLAAEPDAILLDEPFSALDSHLRWEVENLMSAHLSEAAVPTVFVSHNRDEVYRICNMVGCMNQGNLEVVDSVKGFFHNPQTKTAAILSGCKNVTAVQWIDEKTVLLTEWDKKITPVNLQEQKNALGIRAHCFEPVYELQSNIEQDKKYIYFMVDEYKVVEDPFEWIFYFRETGNSKFLQWKVSKKEWDGKAIPNMLKLNANHLLWLNETKTSHDK